MFCICWQFSLASIAQVNAVKSGSAHLGIIAGTIMDSARGEGVPFANLSLVSMSEKAERFQGVSDKNGNFEFNHLPLGYYSLRINALGFSPAQLDSIYLRAERFDFNLGDIKLKYPGQSTLTEVVVYAEKPLFENKDDKLTYNIGESALSNGASTAELLKNIPLVNNDPNGRILLKGKEPRILIDDKPTELNAQQLQDLLESLPGGTIEKIEIMTNPPPQYASEAGGVINIVTKKGKIGWLGRISVSAGTRGEGNFSGNISYRNKKFTYNQTIGLGASKLIGSGYTHRTNLYADSTNQFNSSNQYTNQNLRPNIRTQLDWEWSKQFQMGLVYQGNMNYFDNRSTNQFVNINRFNETYKISNRENSSIGNGYTHGLQLSAVVKGKKNAAEQLRVFLSANTSKNDNDRDFFQQFLATGMVPTGIDSTQSQFFNNINSNWSGRLEYTKPLKQKGSNIMGG